MKVRRWSGTPRTPAKVTTPATARYNQVRPLGSRTVITDAGSIDAHRVLEVRDESSGLEAVVAIDSVREGLSAGGIRRAEYPDLDAARAEAKELARAMTYKCRIAQLPSGGAKTVIRDDDELDLAEAYEVLGERLDRLDPPYLAGGDLGTGPDELAHVREVTDRVNPEGNAPGRATAVGVLSGIQGLLEAIEGVRSAEGGSFLVQGYGAVGEKVAHGLDGQGGLVLVAETDPERRKQAEQRGLHTVDPDTWVDREVDVFVPCATGGVVTEQAARDIEARGICGAANNPLASAKAAEALHERGIVYAPDVVVNAGAAVEGVLTWREGDSPRVRDMIDRRISSVSERAREVLDEARRKDAPPTRVVRRRWG